jgi:hypothetical protein
MRLLLHDGDRRGLVAAVITAGLLLVGGVLVVQGRRGGTPPPQPSVAQSVVDRPAKGFGATSPPSTASSPRLRTTPTPGLGASSATAVKPDFGPLLAASAPVSLRIPSIGVRTDGLVELQLDGSGKLEAPRSFHRAGWYAGGPAPGELGPSVIAGHVDSHAGPAVFYRLGSLEKGATVEVKREDGSTAHFVVDAVARYSKAEFPTAVVYGNTTDRAELRLITCGGAFDSSIGHYVDNIVAFAHLTR